MTLRKYLFLMAAATLMSWGGWALVLFFVNPYESGWVGLLFFYMSFFLGLMGLFSILGFIFRFLFRRNEFVYRQVKRAFRQGFLLALLLSGALFLQPFRLLVWWNSLLLVALMAGVEYMFILKEEKNDLKQIKN